MQIKRSHREFQLRAKCATDLNPGHRSDSPLHRIDIYQLLEC